MAADESSIPGRRGEPSQRLASTATKVRGAVAQVLVQAVGAIALAVVFAAVWSGLGRRELVPTISVTLYIAAALWLLGAGSLAPRLTKMERMKWGTSVSSEDLTQDAARRADRAYQLPPMAAAIFVALILLALGVVLE
jgi:hypothetical protein